MPTLHEPTSFVLKGTHTIEIIDFPLYFIDHDNKRLKEQVN